MAGWTAEVQAQRALAEATLHEHPRRKRMTREEITAMVTTLHDIISVLATADPADKAEICTQLGLTLTYQPHHQESHLPSLAAWVYVRKKVSEGGLEHADR